MPFKSKAQQGFMFSQHPELAKEMASKTHDWKDLPKKVGKGESKYAMLLKKKKES